MLSLSVVFLIVAIVARVFGSYCLPLMVVLAGQSLATAQTQARAVSVPAIADATSTEAGGFLFSIPGVADDFVLFADGAWLVNSNGSARLSALAQSASAINREIFVELEFTGRVAPGAANHPPLGSPVTTLLAQAYVPIGPVDPSTFVYYTQVTGTITGLRSFDGARITVSNIGNAQLGDGASNKNVLSGLAVDLNLTVVQAPVGGNFAPSGPASVRANLVTELGMCATHVDDDVNASGTGGRLAFDLPGVGSDYLFVPSGTWREDDDGTATLSATIKRQSDYSDVWQLDLMFDNRIDPGQAGHPPLGFPIQELLPAIYSGQGGPVDSANWRYYTQATGTLTGEQRNAGGIVQLTASSALQVGLGANQGNLNFGLAGQMATMVSQQPAMHTLVLTGDATLRANTAITCILPSPEVLTGDAQVVVSVTHDILTFTGNDLGFVEQAAIGPYLARSDQRNWLYGFVRVIDHQTVELSIPQGIEAGTHPMRLINSANLSNPLTITIIEPTVPTVRTENDRVPGESQHWVTHQGNVPGFAFSLVVVSLVNTPTVFPGIVNLQIGGQASNFLIVGIGAQDPINHTSVVTYQSVSPSVVGATVYSQAGLTSPTFFPLIATDVWTTVY